MGSLISFILDLDIQSQMWKRELNDILKYKKAPACYSKYTFKLYGITDMSKWWKIVFLCKLFI